MKKREKKLEIMVNIYLYPIVSFHIFQSQATNGAKRFEHRDAKQDKTEAFWKN